MRRLILAVLSVLVLSASVPALAQSSTEVAVRDPENTLYMDLKYWLRGDRHAAGPGAGTPWALHQGSRRLSISMTGSIFPPRDRRLHGPGRRPDGHRLAAGPA